MICMFLIWCIAGTVTYVLQRLSFSQIFTSMHIGSSFSFSKPDTQPPYVANSVPSVQNDQSSIELWLKLVESMQLCQSAVPSAQNKVYLQTVQVHFSARFRFNRCLCVSVILEPSRETPMNALEPASHLSSFNASSVLQLNLPEQCELSHSASRLLVGARVPHAAWPFFHAAVHQSRSVTNYWRASAVNIRCKEAHALYDVEVP